MDILTPQQIMDEKTANLQENIEELVDLIQDRLIKSFDIKTFPIVFYTVKPQEYSKEVINAAVAAFKERGWKVNIDDSIPQIGIQLSFQAEQ